MVTTSPVNFETIAGVARITLAMPDQRNPLSAATIAALRQVFADIARSGDVRAVVLAAEGPVFCSGHDLKEISAARSDADGGEAFFAALLAQCADLMQAIIALPQPVIAATEGMATAAGCQLVASCDLAIAGADAQFCTPGVSLGLFCSTPMVALSRNLQRKHAMEMLLTGDRVSAQDARRFGLVNSVVAAGTALTEALSLAGRIAARSSVALSLGKAAFYQQYGLPLPEAYEVAGRAMLTNLLADDAAEGIAAFLEKRPARWTGK